MTLTSSSSLVVNVQLISVAAAAHLLIALIPSNSFRQSFRSSRNLVSPHKEAILVCEVASVNM